MLQPNRLLKKIAMKKALPLSYQIYKYFMTNEITICSGFNI